MRREMLPRNLKRRRLTFITSFTPKFLLHPFQVYLREQLIVQLEDKQRMIENERTSMELTGDSMELKPVITRKLRRRANEPTNGNGYSRYIITSSHLLTFNLTAFNISAIDMDLEKRDASCNQEV